jgi:hypothetical protein
MQWPSAGRKKESGETLPGVIETVGNAFAMLNKRPYFIVMPIIVDLFLWLGYKLSLAPFTNMVAHWLTSVPSADSTTIDRIRSAGTSFNLFELVAVSTPTMMKEIDPGTIAGTTQRTVDSLPWWTVPELSLLLLVLGVVIGVVYLTLLSYVVRGESLDLSSVVRRSCQYSLRTIGYILLVAGVVLLLSFPVMLLSGVLLGFGIDIVPLTAAIFVLAAMWAYVLLFFAQDAIIISGAGPARAMYLSYNVVRSNFWPCVGLIAVSLLIQIGTPLALIVFTKSALGVPLAFLVHAYILTGLSVAALLFYRDRAAALKSARVVVPSSDPNS